MNTRRLIFALLLAALPFSAAGRQTEVLPRKVRAELDKYNVVYTHMARGGSADNMPLGGGDITVNAWVDESRDLMFYVGKSDSWSEAGRLLKVGRVRVRMEPNPFTEDAKFTQTLNLADGTVDIVADSPVAAVKIRLWADANAPAVRVDLRSSKPLRVFVSNDNMHSEKVFMNRRNFDLGDTFRGLAGAPFEVAEDPDLVIDDPSFVIWAHHNTRSFYDTVLERQNVGALKGRFPDIYMDRIFGTAISGAGLVRSDSFTMSTPKPTKSLSFNVVSLTEQTTPGQWTEDVKALSRSVSVADFEAHRSWWNSFWARSWIFVSGDDEAEAVTRAWILQRYLMAIQGRGAWPVKFNGGSVTFDYFDYDADHRRWGPGFWHQNQRLMYWPLIASGDFDLLKPWFDYYMGLLDFQREVTALQFGHAGAYFPETMNPFGLYIQDDWGWDNPGTASDTRWIRYHWSGALEMLSMMLETWDYTRDDGFARDYIVPFATEVLRFFASHWPRINHTIRFIPANSIEQFWDCLNPTDYIAGIRYDIARLRLLPEGLVSEELLKEWDELEAAVPQIPVRDGRILPAEEYGQGRNAENPELYAVFPFRLYGADSELAQRTYEARVFNESNACWSQDNIQAAILGRTGDAAAFCIKKAHDIEPYGVAFPGFWKAGGDWIPDLDNGGSLAMGLQTMLLQEVGGELRILPSWPEKWQVSFRLLAPGGRRVTYDGASGQTVMD